MDPPSPLLLIEATTTIEELLRRAPQAADYLREKGIRCIRCGEPIWGTLEAAARAKGFDAEQIATFVREINALTRS